MALSRVACGSLARLIHSAALCTHTVLPFYTAGEPGLWPQLVLTAGTSVQQATLLASIKSSSFICTGFLELSVNSEPLAKKRNRKGSQQDFKTSCTKEK